MKCVLYGRKADVTGFAPLSFDNTAIYYDVHEIDLANDKDMQLLAKCLFAAARYDMEYNVSHKDEDPNKKYICLNCIKYVIK